jgi:hypothetical protein
MLAFQISALFALNWSSQASNQPARRGQVHGFAVNRWLS